MSTNNYLSSKLAKINLKADSIISLHLNTLDRVSNEIKILESTLKKAAIPFTFVYITLSDMKKQYTKEEKIFFADDNAHVTVTISEDYGLVWGKTTDGQSRLSYNHYVTEDEYQEFYIYEQRQERRIKGKPILHSSKPLIETEVNIRLKVEKELPIFYEKLIEALKTKSGEAHIVEHSPFLV